MRCVALSCPMICFLLASVSLGQSEGPRVKSPAGAEPAPAVRTGGATEAVLHTLHVEVWRVLTPSDSAVAVDLGLHSGPAEAVQQRIAQLQQSRQVQVSDRIELTLVENQPARMQSQVQKPVVANVTMSATRGEQRGFRMEATGMLLTLTGRVGQDGRILLELQFEKSESLPAAAGGDSDDASVPLPLRTSTVQTSVALTSGEAIVLAGARSDDATSGNTLLLVVAARIVDPRSSAIRTQPYRLQQPTVVPQKSPAPAESRRPEPSPRPSATLRPPQAVESPADQELRARYARYATAFFKRLDKNSNQVLEADETRSNIGSAADANGDQKITEDELLAWLVKKGGQ